MEAFVGVVVALGCPLLMLLPAFIAIGRSNEAKKEAQALQTRLVTVERRVRDLEAQLSAGARAVPATAATAEAPTPEKTAARAEAPGPTEAVDPAPTPDEAPETAPTTPTAESDSEPSADAPSDPADAPTTPPSEAEEPQIRVVEPAPGGWVPLSARSPEEPDPTPTRPPPKPKPEFDLERWLGVRGAAVVGGIVLALAGLLLFKYSIDQGLISPAMRVVGGTLAGLGCIVAGQTKKLRAYGVTANAITGAGCATLYAAFWAAGSLYHLVPDLVAFALMAAVTATCCVLAARQDSLVIALLGLVGGFLTPLLVTTDVENPLGRFAYILVLDIGLLLLARKRGWTALAVLSLVGTVAYQALWVAAEMGPGELGTAVLILGVFSGVFAFAGRSGGGGMRMTQAAALIVPTAFSLYFSLQGPVDGDLWTHGLLLLLLNGAGAWLAREQEQPMLGVGIAAASVPPVAAWLLHSGADVSAQFQAGAIMLAIAIAHHVIAELSAKKGGAAAGAPVAAVLAAVVAGLGLGAMPGTESIWMGEGVALVAGLLLLRQGRIGGVEGMPALVAVVLAGVQLLPVVGTGLAPGFPPFWQWLGLAAGTATAVQVLGLITKHTPTTTAATLHPLLLLFGLWFAPLGDLELLPVLGGSLAIGVLAALAATRRGVGRDLFVGLVGVAGVALVWVVEIGSTARELAPLGAMGLVAGSAAFFTAWPHLGARKLTDRWPWRTSGAAGWAFFLPLIMLWQARWGEDAQGLLPIAMGALAVGSLVALKRLELDDAIRTSAIAWTASAAFGFLSIAVPMQLDHEWITVGWAIEAAAVLLLWRRVDHAGLKYLALTLLTVVGVRLLLNPEVLDYHPRGSMRILNWLAYTYLVPAAAMFASARLLGDLEVGRARSGEASLYTSGKAVLAGSVFMLGLAVVFAWLNLAVVDWFAAGNTLDLDFSRLQARDLAFSIVWAAYALGLLVLGVWRKSKVLRWTSLGLLMVTLVKVFLYDLGELEDLYRVASLVGLAVGLISVSLLYQRFVFRDEEAE